MSDLYLTLKLLHILGSTVLFGTGLGIAFFTWMVNRKRIPAEIAPIARIVVIADGVLIATAVVIQPITGFAMAWMVGYSTFHFWIVASLALYVFVGLCWLPVVWIQIQLRDMAMAAVRDGAALPERYHRLYRIWFILGWPGFLGVVAIFGLMIWKPQWW